MTQWTNIDNKNNKFRLSCDNDDCNLSICNLINGKLHVTTIHNNKRHSLTFSSKDMVFIVSQFLNNLKKEDKIKLLEFYLNNI